MPSLIDRKEESRFIGLFVGKHHSGKTVAEASFPKPSHFYDFDGRIGGAQVPWLDLSGITYDYFPPKMSNLIGDLNSKLDQLLDQSKLSIPGILGNLPKTLITDSVTNQCHSFIAQSIPLTHYGDDNGKPKKRGKWIGPIAAPGPEDYGLEANAMYEYISFLKSIKIQNIILSAHLVDRYGKPKDEDGDELPYADSIVIGEKLSIRDKIGENIQTSFDHIFKFERETINREDRFFVTFRGGIACTSFSWLPYGRHDWTKKPFYEFLYSFRPKEKTL